MTAIVCKLQPRTLLKYFESFPDLNERHLLGCLDIHNERVKLILLRLAQEVRRPGFASEMFMQSTAELLAIELFRHGVELDARTSHGGLAPWQLQLIDERLKQVRDSPSLDELATLCRASVRQLTRGFRISRECSLGAYAASCRVGHAKALLAAGQTVAGTAVAVGFTSTSNFCYAFRKATGLTPREFCNTLLRN